MMQFLLLLKFAKVSLKNCFRFAIIIPGKCKYILLNKNVPICKYIPQGLSNGYHVVPSGFWWFPLVILGYPWLSYPWLSLVSLGYPWLSLVILGYPWLSLVILGYTWLTTIQIYAKLFAHLQFSFPVICRNLLQLRPDKMNMR